MCLYVCVCVCEREREGERERSNTPYRVDVALNKGNWNDNPGTIDMCLRCEVLLYSHTPMSSMILQMQQFILTIVECDEGVVPSSEAGQAIRSLTGT